MAKGIYVGLLGAVLLAATAFVSMSAGAVDGVVAINEIHYNPSVNSAVSDEEFLELFNTGTTDVDLTGYTLDDAGSAAAGTTLTLSGVLPAGEYAVIGKTGFDTFARWGVQPFATMDFGLSNGGDELTLRDSTGTIVDEVFYGDSVPWPAAADGSGSSLELIFANADNSLPVAWGASAGVPTPGAINSIANTAPPSAVTGVVATPFTPTVNQDITVIAQVANEPAPLLHYVVDFGTEVSVIMTDDGVAPDPTANDGVFTAIIPGQAAGELVRYRITSPSNGTEFPTGDDRTYEGVVVEDPTELSTTLVKMEWFIPEVDYNLMFDDPTDRSVFVEGSVLAIDGVVYDNMRVNIRGGDFARQTLDKQGLSFDFAAGVDFLRPDMVPYEIDEFALIAERGWSYGRAFTAWNLFDAAGFETVNAQHVRVQRNGEFYGMFRFSEKLDGVWRNEAGIDGDFYKAGYPGFDDPTVGFEKVQGDVNDFSSLVALSNELQGPASAAKTDYLYDTLDIPNVVNYLATANLVGHFDSNETNFYVHERATTGLWEIHPWDLSNTWGVNNGGVPCDWGRVVEISCLDNEMWQSLSEEPGLDEMVFRRMRTLLEGPMANGELESLFNAYAPGVSLAEQQVDSPMWNQDVYLEIGSIDYEVDKRRDLMLASPKLPAVQAAAPGIVINELTYSPANGVEFLELHNPTTESTDISGWTIAGNGAVIPQGTVILPGGFAVLVRDIPAFHAAYPVSANAPLVQVENGLSGGGELLELFTDTGVLIDTVDYKDTPPWPTEPAAGNVSLSLLDPADDNADGANWGISVQLGGTPGEANDTVGSVPVTIPNVVINELHYNPANGNEEFVELFNAESTMVDISGWDLDGMITFPAGTTIAPGGYLVATLNLANFQAVYPGAAAIEWTSGGLKNSDESVSLETAAGVTVDETEYFDSAPWPTAPDGTGPSLELIDPALDNALAASWKVSAGNGGSPGAANVLCNGLLITVDIGNGDVPTAGDDVILGTDGPDVIAALDGNDTICGLDGDDTISGGAGGDWVDAGDGDDEVFGLDGNDNINGGLGNDTIIGGNDDDNISGSDGADTLNGGLGNDTIEGGFDDDMIFGQAGDDIIDGGPGNDQLLGNNGVDTIGGGAGNDIINGGPDDDTLSGGQDDDTIFGLAGDDIINGEDGNDTLFGQIGNDTIDGGAGDDQLLGNNGNDILTDPSGTNTLNGGADNDQLNGGIGNDQVFGDGNVAQAGDDTIDGGLGADLLIGFAGNDTITSNDGIADTVNGGPHATGDTCTTDPIDTVYNCE